MLGVSGAINWRNFPQGVPGKDWIVDVDTFNALTTRVEQPVSVPGGSGWTPASAAIDIPLPKVGILYELQLTFTGTLTRTDGTGSFTLGWGWPWQLFGNIRLIAGGESAIHSGWGEDFRTRLERLYRVPTTAAVPVTVAAGANAVSATLTIPVAHDLRTGIGALYRQTGTNFLVLHIDPPNLNDLYTLTGNATAVWSAGNLTLEETYCTPEFNQHGQIVLPDVSRMFMSTYDDVIFSNNGTLTHPMPRYPGRMLCMSHVFNQGNGLVISPSLLTQIRFKYGDNQNPWAISGPKLMDKNRRDYYNPLNGGNYWAIDHEVDQAKRDIWYPLALTEIKIEQDIPSSVTPAANSKSHLWMELLVDALG